MATGVVTAMGLSPRAPWADVTSFLQSDHLTETVPALEYVSIAPMILGMVAMPKMFKAESVPQDDRNKIVGGALTGMLLAAGLGISGMVLPSKLNLFLNLGGIANGSWDPTLLAVLGMAVSVSFLAYQFVPNYTLTLFGEKAVLRRPLNTEIYCVPTNRQIDIRLILGEAIFGIGWAMASFCPGPALFHVAVGNPIVLFRWIAAFVVGAVLAPEGKAKLQ
jgi:uncharacterized protein